MGIYHSYFITGEELLELDDIDAAMRSFSRKFYVDADLIVKKPSEDAEPDYDDDGVDLVCARIDLVEADSDLGSACLYELHDALDGLKAKERMMEVVKSVRQVVSIQVINWHLQGDVEEETITPLLGWLLDHRKGVLCIGAGQVYDQSGLLE